MKRKHAKNKKIDMLVVSSSPRGEPVEQARVRVWADVFDAGAVTKFTAMQAGQIVSLCAVIYRAEFRGYTHCEVDGIRYKIIEHGAAESPLDIKLILERG